MEGLKSSIHIGGPALPTHATHAGVVKTRVSDPEAAEVPMGQSARVGFVDEKKVLGARLAHTGAAEVDLAAWLQCGSEQHGATDHEISIGFL